MDTSAYELRLINQLLDTKLFDGRTVRALVPANDAGAAFVRTVIAMCTTGQPDIGEAGRLIAFAAKEYAISQGANGEQALADNVLSQLYVMRTNLSQPAHDSSTLL